MPARRRAPQPFSSPLLCERSVSRALRRTVLPVGVLAALAAASLSPAAITAAYAATANPAPNAGVRNGATRLPFNISGQTSVSVDVGTGNALLTDQLMTLPGINNDVPITLAWNSSLAGSGVPSSVTGTNGSGWSITGFDQRLVANADGSVTYYGAEDLTGVFPLVSGSTTTYTTPGQFKATLVKNADSTWTMTEHQSQNKLAFNASGRLTSITDRNSNVTTFGYNGTGPSYILTSRGGPWSTTHQTASFTTAAGKITKITEANGSSTRSVSFGYDSYSGALTTITDLAGQTTTVLWGDGSAGSPTNEIERLTSPTGALTYLTYGAGNQITEVDQGNSSATGAAGTSTTRITYPSGSQTLVADPATDQSQAVSAVPHTTYNLDSNDRVTSATDPDNHSRSTTYTPFGDTANSTTQATGSTAFNYPTATNNGESLTGVTTAGGASNTAAYGNTGKAQYSPSSATTDSSNSLTYTYDGFGNQATTAQGTGPQAKITYTNPQGQPSTSASPGAASGVVSTYHYDTTFNLTSITPVTGSSLATRTYTYDDYGRLKTATDGRGNTITYSYDGLDRITYVHYSDTSTDDVQYTYDNDSRVTQRLDVNTNKATSYTWDDLGNLLATNNASGSGGTENYTYDKAGYLATRADADGTTTYGYDGAHLLTSVTYPQGGSGGTLTTRFGYDSAGRRTDTWLQSGNTSNTIWAAHESTTYDSSGRVTGVVGQNGPASSPTTVVNQTACYNATAAAPTCSTTQAGDRHQVQWIKNTVTGETTTYAYDTNSRLHTATITGGSNPRTYTYNYNTAGNRTSTSVTGSSPTNQTLTFNNANEITSTGYSYDGAGNQTANPGNTAAYNTAGQQTSTVAGGTTTTYTYAGTNNDELLSESTPNNHTYHYVYGRTDSNGLPEIDQVQYDAATAYVIHDNNGNALMLQPNSGVTALYMNDVLGNPVLLSSSASTTSFTEQYDPYGANTETNVSGGNAVSNNPYVFHYGLQDRVTGNVKFGARYYDPTTGTWTQQDTLNAPLDPNNANRYLYAGGDPINAQDPTGDSWWDGAINDLETVGSDAVEGGGIGGTVGAIAGCAIGALAAAGVGCIPGAGALGGTGLLVGSVIGAGVGAVQNAINDTDTD